MHPINRTREGHLLRGKTVDKVSALQDCLTPIGPWDAIVQQECVGRRCHVADTTLGHTVLFWSSHAGGLMKNTMIGKERSKIRIHEITCIISSKIMDTMPKPSLKHSTEMSNSRHNLGLRHQQVSPSISSGLITKDQEIAMALQATLQCQTQDIVMDTIEGSRRMRHESTKRRTSMFSQLAGFTNNYMEVQTRT